MSKFYRKEGNKYIPIELEQVVTKDWANKLIVVKVGSDENVATETELMNTVECLGESDVLEELEANFLVTSHNMEFRVLDSLKSLKNQNVVIRVNATDDVAKMMPEIQKKVKEMMKEKCKKVVFLPVPLTVGEYEEVTAIKKRCDTRRSRRGI